MGDTSRELYSPCIRVDSIVEPLGRNYVFSLKFIEIYFEYSCRVWTSVWVFDVLCWSRLVFRNHLNWLFFHVNRRFSFRKDCLEKKEKIEVYWYRCTIWQFPLLFFSSYQRSLWALSPSLSVSQSLMIYQTECLFRCSSHNDHNFFQFEKAKRKESLCFLECWRYLFEWNWSPLHRS